MRNTAAKMMKMGRTMRSALALRLRRGATVSSQADDMDDLGVAFSDAVLFLLNVWYNTTAELRDDSN